MYSTRTIIEDNTIYTCSSQQIEAFCEIHESLASLLPTYDISILSSNDQVISHFNYWIQLAQLNAINVPKIDYLISHSLSIQLHQSFAQNEHINLFIQQYSNPYAIYALTYFVSKEFLTIFGKYTDFTNTQEIKENLPNDSYYALSNYDFENLYFKPLNEFHIDIFTKFKANPVFHRELQCAIKLSIQLAEQFIQEQKRQRNRKFLLDVI